MGAVLHCGPTPGIVCLCVHGRGRENARLDEWWQIYPIAIQTAKNDSIAWHSCASPRQADVTPVPQDDGPNPACPIAYAKEYRDAMDYFRAIYSAGEVSERALALTEVCPPYLRVAYPSPRGVCTSECAPTRVRLQWCEFRSVKTTKLTREGRDPTITICDMSSGADWGGLSQDVIDMNAANYTAWQFRRKLVAALGKDLTEELEYISEMVQENIKNYQVSSVGCVSPRVVPQL